MEKNFKTYIGTKTVKAMPMTYHEAGQKDLIREYKKDVKEQCGYCVQYADGYKSWSPANVFEEAYKCAETFLDCLQIEFSELTERFNSLDTFLSRGFDHVIEKVGNRQAAMLISQHQAMQAYLHVLESRIDDLKQNINAQEGRANDEK